MLINNETWADLHESYGHVQIDDMHQADKDRIFKEAVNSLDDELMAIGREVVSDGILGYLTWPHKRGAFDKMHDKLWAHIEATAQAEADEWEALSDDTQD